MDNGREDQNPWSRWFWQDYESDTGLRLCGLAAQGLWMRMLSIMAKSKRKGFLLDGESKMESKSLAKLVGESIPVTDTLLEELRRHEVYSQTKDGIIFNRRMVRGGHISEVRAEAGRLGGLAKSKTKASRGSKMKAASASASAYASASDLFNKFLTTITDSDREGWGKAYPACELDIEIAKAVEWVKSNPVKGRKSNWRKFLTGWFNRTQDRGGTVRGKVQRGDFSELDAWAAKGEKP